MTNCFPWSFFLVVGYGVLDPTKRKDLLGNGGAQRAKQNRARDLTRHQAEYGSTLTEKHRSGGSVAERWRSGAGDGDIRMKAACLIRVTETLRIKHVYSNVSLDSCKHVLLAVIMKWVDKKKDET
ncbi:hypothetical protein Bca52824_095318 [Brassica carinata]|uniref:Uncharacterized protein n=1 Tax=Brassica carinata TaxID=52824 RepID=A0A8X7P1Y1_BRACI|nr:hypothetical protein Bca52824_095318 [Brassica carinata]